MVVLDKSNYKTLNKKIIREAFDFDEIARQVAMRTDKNYHGEALLYIAQSLGLSGYAKRFELINGLQNIDGHLNSKLGAYRDEISKEMLKYIGNKYGKDIYNKIIGAL